MLRLNRNWRVVPTLSGWVLFFFLAQRTRESSGESRDLEASVFITFYHGRRATPESTPTVFYFGRIACRVMRDALFEIIHLMRFISVRMETRTASSAVATDENTSVRLAL